MSVKYLFVACHWHSIAKVRNKRKKERKYMATQNESIESGCPDRGKDCL